MAVPDKQAKAVLDEQIQMCQIASLQMPKNDQVRSHSGEKMLLSRASHGFMDRSCSFPVRDAGLGRMGLHPFADEHGRKRFQG
jgi:hypothetical protein